MNLLLFSSTYFPRVGGVETVTRRLATGLTEMGHRVTVVTNRYPRSLPPMEMDGAVEVRRRLYPNVLPSPGRRGPASLGKLLLALPLAWFELVWLVRFLRQRRPDAITIHYFSYPAAYALVAARLAGVPAVLSFHGSDVPTTPYPASYRWTTRIACRLASAITTNSRDLRAHLETTLAPGDFPAIDVIPLGVDIEAGEPRTAGETNTILVLGRLVPKKGVETSIEAMAIVSRRNRDARLTIAGDGPIRRELEQLTRSLGVERAVTFAGSLGADAAQQAIRDCAILVIPSHWEAFGMVALEAMAAGRAVVATRSGGVEEIVVDGETGILVPPGDAQELASAIETLLRDSSLRDHLGAGGRNRARDEYSWTAVTKRYSDLLRSVVSEERSTGGYRDGPREAGDLE